MDDFFESILSIGRFLLYIFYGPHRLLFFLFRWYEETHGFQTRNALYDRVGVPCAGVITHRYFQKDGDLIRYAYRPPQNPNMIYIRDYIREPMHQLYPWGVDKALVVLVVPGHCASGLEIRKLNEPAETFWRRILFSSL